MATEATHHIPDHRRAADEWLPGWLRLRFAGRKVGGRWFVLIEEFDITGMGATPEEARDEALSLLAAYLRAHHEDGTAFEKTLRPIPRRLRVRITLGTLLHRLLGAERTEGALAEEKALIPRSALNGAAAA